MKHQHPKNHSPCAILRENTDARTRLGVLSFYDAHCPHAIELLILIIEYLQLFAQIALQASQVLEAYDTPNLDSEKLLSVLFSCLKIFDIGQFVDFNTDADIIIIFFSFCLIYVLSLFSLAIYIGFAVKLEFEPRRNILMIWRWIIRLHGPIIFYVIASFCFCMLRAARQDLLNFAPGNEAFYISASLILLVICFAFALAIWIKYSLILPSKSFNSCKSHTPEIITICQKFTLGTMFIFLPDNSFTSFWVLAVISILFSLLRSVRYFSALPNFNLRAMYFKGYLINMETTLNLVILLRGFIISFSVRKLGTLFTVGTTLVLIPFIVRFTSSYLTNTIIRLLTSPCKKMKVEKLLHKIMIVKQVRQRMKTFNKFSKDSDLYYFLYTVLTNNIKAVFQISEEEGTANPVTLELDPSTSAYKVIIMFLTNLSKRHPHNDLIKLYLAYYHGKKMKTYCTALQIIRDIINQSRSSKLVLNAMLITYEIQKIVKEECIRNTEPLDILEYVQNLERVISVEQKIKSQGELQASLCQEFKHNNPNVSLFNRKAQTVEQLRQNIRKNMARFVSHNPEYNIEPLLMFASYELILNYNAKEYLHFLKMYFNKYSKYLYKYRSHDLNQENLFHHDRLFLIVSAQKDNAGIIQYASKSTKNVLGWDSKLITGTGFTQLLPVPTQKHYNLLIKNVMENSDQATLGRVEKAFVYHRDGYIMHVDQYIQVHPYVNNGLFLNMIFRPVQESAEYLLVSKDGNIEAYTKGIGKKLGLSGIHDSKMNISTLCKEFASVNYAFNLMSSASEGLKMMKTTTANKVKPVVKLSAIGKLKSSFRKALMRRNHLAQDSPLTAEESRAIFEKLTTVGKTYFLEKTAYAVNENSLKSVGTGTGSKIFTTRQTTRFAPVAYHCYVSNWISGSNPLKVWTLADAEIDPATGQPGSGTPPTRTTTNKFNQERVPSNTTIYTPELKKGKTGPKRVGGVMQKIHFRWDKDIEHTQMPEDQEYAGEEKEGGWIDMEKLLSSERQELVLGSRKSSELRSSDKRYSMSKFNHENPDSLTKRLEEIVESPLPVQMQARNPIFQRMKKDATPGTIISTTSRNLSFRKHGMKQFDMIKKSHFGAQEDEEEEQSQDIGDIDFGEEPSHSMHQSQHGAVDHKASKPIRDSLEMKYYPKSYWVFLVLFYLMIAMTFSVQVLLEHKFSTYLEDISEQKDVFKDSASRTELLILTERKFRMLYATKYMAVTPQAIASLTGETEKALPMLRQLTDVNQNLTLTMDFLSDEQREEVDRADVKIYDTYYSSAQQQYMELESYQATGRIIEAGYRLVSQMTASFIKVLPTFRFIFRNSLNDLLLKSQSITHVLLGSLITTRNQILVTTRITLIISLFILLCCLTAGLVIIFRTFKSLNEKMKAFIKLNDTAVSEVHGKIDIFLRILRTGEYIEFLEESFASKNVKTLEAVKNNSHSKISLKEVNNRGLKKQFYIHAINFSIMLVCLIIIIVVNFILLTQNLWLCQSSLDQISFTNNLKEAVMLSATSALELYSENGTTYMRNNPVLDELLYQTNQVEQIRTQMARAYINDNQQYDPIIELILFKDGCQVFTAAEQVFCQQVRAGVNDVSLLSLMSTVETTLVNQYELFTTQGGGSLASLLSLITTFYPLVATVEALNTHLASRIDENFDELTQEVSSQSDVTFGLVYPATAVLCLFIWFTVLRVLSETDNKFKNVLKLLPPSLVTTNFVLKSFIMRTSTGLINSAFSEI